MTSLTAFTAVDLLKLNPMNLDALTENYSLDYYLGYMFTWPSLMFKVEDTLCQPVGYMIGKSEGPGLEWHSHITAVTVAPTHRRLGLAKLLVDQLTESSNAPDQRCYFMDLYVRTSNRIAVDMYKRFGFHTFRRVLGYYSPGSKEDAFDMRMPLLRDPQHNSLKRSAHTVEEPYDRYQYDASALA